MTKMNKIFFLGLAIVAAGAAAFGAGQVSIPYTNTFEMYDSGYRIANEAGWYALRDEVDMGIITNWADHGMKNPYVYYVSHSNVLDVAGTVSNSITYNDQLDDVYVDLLIRPQLREDPPEFETVPHAAFYINSLSNLVFFHGYYDPNLAGNGYASLWTTNTLHIIDSNVWVRLSVRMSYKSDPDSFDSYYQFRVNGGDLVTNLMGYASNGYNDQHPSGGPWFMCGNVPNQGGQATISSFTINGFAQVDDLVLTTNPPPAVGSQYTTNGTPYSWLDGHGLVTGGDYDGADLNDWDGDGQRAFQEYWAGTHPKESNSVFKVISVYKPWTVVWLGGTNESSPPFVIYRSTNLTFANPWTQLPHTNFNRALGTLGTNVWVDPDGTNFGGTSLFYRVTAPTNALP